MLDFLANKFKRITTNQLYLPEIDGMRFLSLSLVTLFHIRGYFLEKTSLIFTDNPGQYHWLNKFFVNADRSVPLFFAISGFILCMPFAHHYINHGKKIDLKLYYVRRLTRLEPPYILVMICIFLAQLAIKNYDFKSLFPSLLASLAYCCACGSWPKLWRHCGAHLLHRLWCTQMDRPEQSHCWRCLPQLIP